MQNKQELIREIVPVGNSAGVILPKGWLNGKAKIILLEEPLDLKKDILNIVDEYLEDVLGIYLVGSYARGEPAKESDIDVLAVTGKTGKRIKKGKYDIIMISKKNLENELNNNAIPLLPMLKEAKPLLNRQLIEEYKRISLSRKNVKNIIEITRSSLDVISEFIKLGPAKLDLSYSLILNLRTIYVLDCMRKGKSWSTKGLKELARKLDVSEAYEEYLKKKSGKNANSISLEKAEKMYKFLDEKTKEWEKWLKGRKG